MFFDKIGKDELQVELNDSFFDDKDEWEDPIEMSKEKITCVEGNSFTFPGDSYRVYGMDFPETGCIS